MIKKYSLIFIVFYLVTGCSDPNQPYIDSIREKVQSDAMGFDLNYQSIEFNWVDTLKINDKINRLETAYSEKLKEILDLEYHVYDNHERDYIFSKKYISEQRLLELRNWEDNMRGMPFNEYDNYTEFAFSNRNQSEWLQNYTSTVEKTDKLINKYESLNDGNLELIRNAVFYYERIDSFHNNRNVSDLWGLVRSQIYTLESLSKEINSWSEKNPNEVIHYVAENKFQINNPMFNNAEQQITDKFYFNKNFEIIKREGSL